MAYSYGTEGGSLKIGKTMRRKMCFLSREVPLSSNQRGPSIDIIL